MISAGSFIVGGDWRKRTFYNNDAAGRDQREWRDAASFSKKRHARSMAAQPHGSRRLQALISPPQRA
jgi:hypothetical protein